MPLIYPPRFIQLMIVAIVGWYLVMSPGHASALEISTPVGIQEIGRPLELKGTLSGIPEGVESQLRTTCLKASLRSLDSKTTGLQPTTINNVKVNFEPTIRQGGLIEFVSSAAVNDAIVELILVSECPLLTFSSRWTLIMNQTMARPVVEAEPSNRQPMLNKFDLGNSSLLAASRKMPNLAINVQREPETIQKKVEEPKPTTEVDEMPAQVKPELTENILQEEDPLKVASNEQSFLNNGLIESHKTNTDAQNAVELGESSLYESFPFVQTNLFFAAWLAALGLLLFGAIRYRKKRVRVSGNAGSEQSNPLGQPQSTHTFREGREPTLAPSDEAAAGHSDKAINNGRDRFLESLIGSDEKLFDESFGLPTHLNSLDSADTAVRSTLKISLELINRADIRKWSLPDSYQSLVQERNRSLEQNKLTETLILRCQIGLVELAFQDAKQSKETNSQVVLELITQVFGEYIYDAESYPTMNVPDLVKSHVRAKMCEVAGAENRQLLRENLLNLNNQVSSSALCFHSDAWREFLSEEGILV